MLDKNHQQKVSRQEVVAMAEMGEDEGSIREKESDIIENLFNLNDVVAEDVMTPRSVIFALQKDSTVGDVVGEHTPIAFSRIPIFDKDMDDILGFVHRYDLVNKQAEDQFHIKMKDISEPIHAPKCDHDQPRICRQVQATKGESACSSWYRTCSHIKWQQ